MRDVCIATVAGTPEPRPELEREDFPAFRTDKWYYPTPGKTIDHFRQLVSIGFFPRRPVTNRFRVRRRSTSEYNSAIVVEGPRQYIRMPQGQYPPHLRDLISVRDCYAAWGNSRHDQLRQAILPVTAREAFAGNVCHLVRAARGILYAEETVLRGIDVVETKFYTLLIKLSIIDHGSSGDTLILDMVPNPDHAQLDQNWLSLIFRAQEGFEKHCAPLPPKVAAWRQAALHQEHLFLEHSASFCSEIIGLSLADAIKTVKEPWQLQAVAAVFGFNLRRVETLTHLLPFNDERKRQLQEMATLCYVLPEMTNK